MAKSRMLLETHLKALRLPTFLREYDKLARRCATEGLDFRDFLQQLCELNGLRGHKLAPQPSRPRA